MISGLEDALKESGLSGVSLQPIAEHRGNTLADVSARIMRIVGKDIGT